MCIRDRYMGNKIKLQQLNKANKMFLQKHLQNSLCLSWTALKFFAIKSIPLPELGEKIKEATIKKWHVSIGDTIEEFDGVCDVVTDKLFTTIPASYSGKITKIHHKEEEICQTFAPLYDMDIEGEAKEEPVEEKKPEEKPVEAPKQQQAVASAEGTQVKQIPLPELGEKIKEATIKKWHVKEGDTIEEFDGICDVVTDKLFTTIPASYSGKIKKIYHKEDEICQTFAPLYDIEVEGGAKDEPKAEEEQKPVEAPKKQEEKPKATESPKKGEGLSLAPAVRSLLKKHNIEPSQVKGTGKEGRITKDDVMAFVEKGAKKEVAAPVAVAKEQKKEKKVAAAPAIKQGGRMELEFETMKMTDYQKGMQKSMTAANSIPHMFLMDDIEVTELVKMRNYIKKELKKNITFMPFFLKAFSLAMIDYPMINAYYEPETKPFELRMCKNHNISIAIDSPQGLVVPSIKNVQEMNIFDIQEELTRIRKSAEEAKVTANDLFDGTVTFSNIGNITGTYDGPLIVPPQVLIVGMGKMTDVPKYAEPRKGEVQRKIVNVSFGVDHRVLDGATVARFVKKWKSYIENPVNFILQMK
eukprot:TRINITY_DN321_c0_g2_i3.p1 TRINITY_DN321_c0_g2~~TRINITY_DN321_c0_g2_i3.p1  ORF type:complete len:582 (+),score=125.52 TRINITY_DN321_c0_g2_i3:174-1919(+)